MKTFGDQVKGFNLAWWCALINAYSSVLFCFVFYKLCQIVFSTNLTRNWLQILMYSLIICDLIVGCSTYTSIVIQPDVYAQETRHDVGSSTIVLLNIQKILYCAMILTQLFEWKMYIIFITFQSSNKPEELIGLKKKYNLREKIYFYVFLATILAFGCLQIAID